MSQSASAADRVRLDKWLWAARFYKTRAIAKQAIEGGKVHYNGARSKPSRFVEIGAQLRIRQGNDEKQVVVMALSEQRRGAPEAATLYQETEESRQQREALGEERRAQRAALAAPERRPNKKDRRQIRGFKEQSLERD